MSEPYIIPRCYQCANMVLGQYKDGSPLYWCRYFTHKVEADCFCAWAVQRHDNADEKDETNVGKAMREFLEGKNEREA